ncbi:MAG: cell division protein FtsQ/DivIB [Bacteroidales bacterium]|jgi:cell division protein FtsQ|nr:cell division protein FtsQ/DivIB [Bacteroidales bacterium]
MKKALKILTVIPLLYLVIVPVYLAGSTNRKSVARVSIIISDSSDYHFITGKYLHSVFLNGSGDVTGKPVRDVSLGNIEKNIKTLRELKTVEAYTTIDRKLVIWAAQRHPVMRVMPDEGGDYFIDEEGIVVRKRNAYNPRLHMVVGNINISRAMLNGVSILDTTVKNTILKDIYYLVEFIGKDSFWSAQIDQVFVDRNNEINLIPRIGNHTVHLGSAENVKTKFENLEAFYKNVLPEVGWNKYSVINLEFKDQIVCKKR